jgi:hypothetical protein
MTAENGITPVPELRYMRFLSLVGFLQQARSVVRLQHRELENHNKQNINIDENLTFPAKPHPLSLLRLSGFLHQARDLPRLQEINVH